MNYLNCKAYEGKTGNYNIMNVDCYFINQSNSSAIKKEIGECFNKNLINCLNLEKVIEIDLDGTSSLLVFNRLHRENKKDSEDSKAILLGVNKDIREFLRISQIEKRFEISSINDL